MVHIVGYTSMDLSHPPRPVSKLHPLHLHLHCCPANRSVSAVFLDSTYMRSYMASAFLFLTCFTRYDRLEVHPHRYRLFCLPPAAFSLVLALNVSGVCPGPPGTELGRDSTSAGLLCRRVVTLTVRTFSSLLPGQQLRKEKNPHFKNAVS